MFVMSTVSMFIIGGISGNFLNAGIAKLANLIQNGSLNQSFAVPCVG